MITNFHRQFRVFINLGMGLLLVGCAAAPVEVKSVETATAIHTQPIIATQTTLPPPTEIPQPAATRRPTTEKSPSITPPPKIITALAPTCSDENPSEYLATVLPLADQATLDAKIGEKMAELTSVEIGRYLQAAIDRLEKLKGVTPPACLQAAHAKLASSFESLVEAWKDGQKADYENSRLALISFYSDMSEAVAGFAGY